jgi:hypothetical protein
MSEETLADVRAVRHETVLERSIAARRSGRGQIRVPSKFGPASKARTLDESERSIIERDLRRSGRL